MQLREIIKEIRQRKSWTQVQLAQYLEIHQQNVQGMENAGSTLEKQWTIFMKLLPLCQELGIDAARDSQPITAKGIIQRAKTTGERTGGNVEVSTDGIKTGRFGNLSTRRIPGSKADKKDAS